MPGPWRTTWLGFARLLQQWGRGPADAEELAEAAGLSPRSVSDLEPGIDRATPEDAAVFWAARWAWPAGRRVVRRGGPGRVPAAEVLAAVEGGGGGFGTSPPVIRVSGRDDLLAEVRERLLAGVGGWCRRCTGWAGWADPGGGRVRAPVHPGLRPGVVDKLRAGQADQRPVRRPRACTGMRAGRDRTEAVRRQCWPICGSSARGCWSLATPSCRGCGTVAAWRRRACADHDPERGWDELARAGPVYVLARPSRWRYCRAG